MKSLLESIRESILDMTDDDNLDKRSEMDIAKIGIMRFLSTSLWGFGDPTDKYCGYKVKIGKDAKGYYIDTEGDVRYKRSGDLSCIDFTEYQNKIDIYNNNWEETHNGMHCPMFRWRKHTGNIRLASNLENLSSIKGLPDDIDYLCIPDGCAHRNDCIIDFEKHRINTLCLLTDGWQYVLKGKYDIAHMKLDDYLRPKLRGFKCNDIKFNI